MGTILIGYDLNHHDNDYAELAAAIRAFGAWWHYLDSTWIVKTNSSAKAVRDALSRHLDSNDELLVVDISGDAAAWKGFDESGGKWLNDNL